MAASEDCCVICAEPLTFISVGKCGHTDVCSLCAARMRGVMNDFDCCICKQKLNEVFITRYAGSFTSIPKNIESSSGDTNGSLKERAKQGELWHDERLNAFFDDYEHFKVVRYDIRYYIIYIYTSCY